MLSEFFHQIGRLFNWIIIVAPWEQALRIRLGKNVKILKVGWYFRIPFIDRIYRQSIRKRIITVSPQVLTTKDGKPITVGGCISYAIVDLRKLFDTLEHAEATIEADVTTKIAAYISSNVFSGCSTQAIEEYVLQEFNLEDYGLSGTGFCITSFATVKTYRFITGEIAAWSSGRELDTTESIDNRND